MATIHEHLVNIPEENTVTDVMWGCTACGAKAGFNREGLGEPFASETAYPENIDDYMGATCVPALFYVPRDTFYGQFGSDEIVAILDSTDKDVRALVFRFNQLSANGVPINHPLVVRGLAYIEAQGLIGTGRADAILTACTP